ncbi:sugar transferase [Novosphingobium sp. 1949]|uniref:Sugar transferase n=1 Tax=Novosphingobium organovorum TaxID=2930092 RepID=A0ABT0BJ87_9SPHN|nr:sugar transferase [Novosphingobium organovorum]MCJ2185128.1 sugar transferase [Novosphingobium organovorum]
MIQGAARSAVEPMFRGAASDFSDRAATLGTDWEQTPAPGVSAVQATVWRVFDITFASAILIVLLPFLVFMALFLFLSDPGPIFYAHKRVGFRGRFFNCLKFRTMHMDGDAILRRHLELYPEARSEWEKNQKLRADPRVTAVGAIMRKFSLDEFPQLINVIRGDMSIVGPRPIILAEVERYGRLFEYYCRVRPGLTGIWQTSGRSDVSFRSRVEMDLNYIVRKGVALDLWLMAKTVPAVALAKGAY